MLKRYATRMLAAAAPSEYDTKAPEPAAVAVAEAAPVIAPDPDPTLELELGARVRVRFLCEIDWTWPAPDRFFGSSSTVRYYAGNVYDFSQERAEALLHGRPGELPVVELVAANVSPIEPAAEKAFNPPQVSERDYRDAITGRVS